MQIRLHRPVRRRSVQPPAIRSAAGRGDGPPVDRHLRPASRKTDPAVRLLDTFRPVAGHGEPVVTAAPAVIGSVGAVTDQLPAPLSVPPPPAVRAAAALVGVQALGLGAVAVLALLSGLRTRAPAGELIGQLAYYLVLGVGVAAVGYGLVRGRRWSRTPAIVIQIISGAVGVWLLTASGQPLWGGLVLGVALLAGWLLLSGQANTWIKQFPPVFGPER